MSRLPLITPAAVTLAATFALVGCAPAPAPAPVAPVIQPAVPMPAVSGLEERKPDLCRAKDYTSAVGQPASAVAAMGITRTYRIAEFRGIDPQDYDPNRIVFRLDQAGLVQSIDCG